MTSKNIVFTMNLQKAIKNYITGLYNRGKTSIDECFIMSEICQNIYSYD